MKLITIAHQKGGVGKTTLALNLAYCFAEDLRVCLVDADLQGSAMDLTDYLSGISVVSLDQFLIDKELDRYDLAIVDTPPYLSNRLPELFGLSDFVLIPTKPGFLDAMAIRATIALLRQTMDQRPDLKAGIVLNMLTHRSNLASEVKELLDGYGLPVLQSSISQRVSYARSPITQGIFQSDDQKAKVEVTELAEEIIQHITATNQ